MARTNKYHVPVMLNETLEYLNLAPGKIIIDATVGTAGHSSEIIKRIRPSGKLIAIDRDQQSLLIAKERLADFSGSCEFVHANFMDLDTVLGGLNIKKVDGILFDLGISSFQLEDAQRGFSFQSPGPLDMRLDTESYISAYDLVNNLNEEEISAMLWNFGQERWHNRIAHLLVKERQRHPISTTAELSDIIVRAIPHHQRSYRIHPATRTFQAVRIAVNRELEALSAAVEKAITYLDKNARICVISFHSLEDRIVKFAFRKADSENILKIITPKPLVPSAGELETNPPSRSAKFRVGQRI